VLPSALIPENLPVDPSLAWGVLIASVLGAFAPYLLGKARNRSRLDSSDSASAPPSASAAAYADAAADVQDQLLSSLVIDARVRAETAESRLEAARCKVGELEAEVAKLTTEVEYLRGQSR
jgi:hypothetical protein